MSVGVRTRAPANSGFLEGRLTAIVDDLIAALPSSERICAGDRRGIIARYCAVLEGNFIYWMTAALLSAKSESAISIIRDNLFEEVRDCHPGMLHKFARASRSVPDSEDAEAVSSELTDVRLFLGNLSSVPIIAMMAFFEEFIRKFMPYLAELAKLQGSEEFEYTRVHSICDLVHTQELLKAFTAEMAAPAQQLDRSDETVLEGVYLLHALIRRIIAGAAAEDTRHEGNAALLRGTHFHSGGLAQADEAPGNRQLVDVD